MRISLGGISEVSDTLRIDLQSRVSWQDVTGLLNIPGAVYFYVSRYTIGVRYNKEVEVLDFAAQCLQVVMRHFGVGIEELSVGIHDTFISPDSIPEVADDIWSRSMTALTPETVPLHRVEIRGSGPAYWLR